jgi:hypothetical protein
MPSFYCCPTASACGGCLSPQKGCSGAAAPYMHKNCAYWRVDKVPRIGCPRMPYGGNPSSLYRCTCRTIGCASFALAGTSTLNQVTTSLAATTSNTAILSIPQYHVLDWQECRSELHKAMRKSESSQAILSS